jgi:hypothetical protein
LRTTFTLTLIFLAGMYLKILYGRVKKKLGIKKEPLHHDTEFTQAKPEPKTAIFETHSHEPERKTARWSHAIEAEDAVVVTEEQTRQNEDKGQLFEEYIVSKFDKRVFKFEVWCSDKKTGTRYPKSNMYPDLEFIFSYKGIEKHFAVECKFRTRLFNNAFDIGAEQLQRYREYEATRKIDVYLVLGLGGQPEAPKELFLIPLTKLTSLDHRFLLEYKKKVDKDFFMDKDTLILK